MRCTRGARATSEPRPIPRALPPTNPSTISLNVIHKCGHRKPSNRFWTSTRATAVGRGRTSGGRRRHCTRPYQAASTASNSASDKSRSLPRRWRRGVWGCNNGWDSNCIHSSLPEQPHGLMNSVAEISKTALETHLQGTWTWQGHGKGMRNGPRAPAHQQHTISQEHRFSNIVGDKYHRLLAMLPHIKQLQVELFTGNGIKRAKRFIHK